MPRSARIWEPGDILSIVVRSHEGRPIFVDDDDRRFFVDRLRRVFAAADVELLAWSLLVNHFHIVIRVTRVPPATLFLRLNTALARRERRRRGDHGAVFQDRYWSRRCAEELLRLLTYVLGNPAHHGVVSSVAALESYPWTATPEVLGLAPPDLVDPRKTLSLIDPDEGVARALLRDALLARVAEWRAKEPGVDACDEPGCRGEQDGCRLVHVVPQPMPGSQIFACATQSLISTSTTAGVHDERLNRAARLRAAGWQPADLIAPIARRLGADPAGVLRGARIHSACRARAVLIHVACDGVGVPAVDIARLVGVGASAVSAARQRGSRLLAEHGWSMDDVVSWPSRT